MHLTVRRTIDAFSWRLLTALLLTHLLAAQKAILALLIFSFLLAAVQSLSRFIITVVISLCITTLWSELPVINQLLQVNKSHLLIVFLVTYLSLCLFSRLFSNNSPEDSNGIQTYLALTIPAAGVSIFRLAINSREQFLRFLSPEDNYSWIHAASGFLRYDASIQDVAASHYSVEGFFAVSISVIAQITSFIGSEIDLPLAIPAVINTYVFFSFLLITSTFNFVYKTLFKKTGEKSLASFVAGWTSVISILFIWKISETSGHLSLVVLISVIATLFLIERDSAFNPSHFLFRVFFYMFLYSTGTIWFPVVPVCSALLLAVGAMSIRANLLLKPREPQALLLPVFELCAVSLLAGSLITRYLLNESLVDVLMAQGGVFLLSTFGVGSGIVLVSLAIEYLDYSVITKLFLSFLVLFLSGVWALNTAMSEGETTYGPRKFALFVTGIAALHLPLLSVYICKRNNISRITSIAFFVGSSFVFLLGTIGFRVIPERFLGSENPTPNTSWLERAINLSEQRPNTMVLCYPNIDDQDFQAYFCSRFVAALQFQERDALGLDVPRAWRSSLFGDEPSRRRIASSVKQLVESGQEVTLLPVSLQGRPKDDIWLKEVLNLLQPMGY